MSFLLRWAPIIISLECVLLGPPTVYSQHDIIIMSHGSRHSCLKSAASSCRTLPIITICKAPVPFHVRSFSRPASALLSLSLVFTIIIIIKLGTKKAINSIPVERERGRGRGEDERDGRPTRSSFLYLFTALFRFRPLPSLDSSPIYSIRMIAAKRRPFYAQRDESMANKLVIGPPLSVCFVLLRP